MNDRRITFYILFIPFILNGCTYINKTDTDEAEIASQSIEIDKQKHLDLEKFYLKEELDESLIKKDSEQKIYDNLWAVIQDGLVLESNVNRKKVRDKIKWFSRNQQYIDRVV